MSVATMRLATRPQDGATAWHGTLKSGSRHVSVPAPTSVVAVTIEDGGEMASRSPTRGPRRRVRLKPPRRGPGPPKTGARELAIFAFAYLVYFGVRAITEGGVAAADANARTLIDLERELGIAWEGALQDAALSSRIAISAANAVYVYGHWPLIILVGVLLFRYRRPGSRSHGAEPDGRRAWIGAADRHRVSDRPLAPPGDRRLRHRRRLTRAVRLTRTATAVES